MGNFNNFLEGHMPLRHFSRILPDTDNRYDIAKRNKMYHVKITINFPRKIRNFFFLQRDIEEKKKMRYFTNHGTNTRFWLGTCGCARRSTRIEHLVWSTLLAKWTFKNAKSSRYLFITIYPPTLIIIDHLFHE